MNPDRLYDLTAVVVHCGSGPNRGHYISIVRSHGFWLLFDDDMVDVSAVYYEEHEEIYFNCNITNSLAFTENRGIHNRGLLWVNIGYTKVVGDRLYPFLSVARFGE